MLTIPFDAETLKKIITQEIQFPVISYKDSKIKGKQLITYLSNLKYKNISISFDGVPKEEKFDLLVEYVKHQSMVRIEQLENTIIKCVFCFKGFDLSLVDLSELDKEYFEKCIIDNDEMLYFVDHNKELFLELTSILDGIILYAIKNLTAWKTLYGEEIKSTVETGVKQVGKTFVNMLQNEVFNYHYYTVLPKFSDLVYYDHYYERPIYSGKTLISYISSNCVIFPLLKMIIDCSFSTDQLTQIDRELNATSI